MKLMFTLSVYKEAGHVTYGSLLNKVTGQSGLNIQQVCSQFFFYHHVYPKWWMSSDHMLTIHLCIMPTQEICEILSSCVSCGSVEQ